MSIQCTFSPDGRPEGQFIGDIVPGQVFTMSDVVDGIHSILVMKCLENDEGGEVFRYVGTPNDHDPERQISSDYLTRDFLLAEIANGASFRKKVDTAKVRGELVLRHLSDASRVKVKDSLTNAN